MKTSDSVGNDQVVNKEEKCTNTMQTGKDCDKEQEDIEQEDTEQEETCMYCKKTTTDHLTSDFEW